MGENGPALNNGVQTGGELHASFRSERAVSEVRPRPVRGPLVASPDILRRGEEICGYAFQKPELLETALTHASVASCRLNSNERLEFLGDAVLGLVICSALYERHHDKLEGMLTKVKSMVVSRKTCAEIADRIGLTDLLILGKGMTNRQHLPMSIRAAVYEAMIGSIYVDGGLEPARSFILRTTQTYLDSAGASDVLENYKSALQQHCQRRLSAVPRYLSLDEQGPDHSKSFEVCVVIGEQRYPSAWGPSKKEAEQKAAKVALLKLTDGTPASAEFI